MYMYIISNHIPTIYTIDHTINYLNSPPKGSELDYPTGLIQFVSNFSRGIHSGHRVDIRLGVSGRFEIKFCVHIVFYIILNLF